MAAPTYTARTAWSIASSSALFPFDTTGAVGPDSVLSVSNQGVDCYTKEGTQLWAEDLATFFGLGGAPFDPRVVYDPGAERFFVIAVDGREDDADDESNLFIAVSADSAPQAGHDEDATQWTILSEDVSGGGEHWLDYPLLGFNADVVSIMGLQRAQTGFGVNHYTVYVVPKSDLTDAEPPTLANMATLDIAADPTYRNFAHPVSDLDNGSGDATMWAWNYQESKLERQDITLNGSYSLVVPVDIPYTNVTSLSAVEQPPSGGPVEDDELLNNFVSNRIGTSPVRVGGYDYLAIPSRNAAEDQATIVVVKIDTTVGSSDLNTIVAKTVLEETGLSLIYPSIAVNSSGHIVVGCTSVGAAATAWASAMIFVGQDDGATMTFAAGEVVQAGQRYYEKMDVDNRNRWGDYSATVVDPLSPTRFWTFQGWAWDNMANETGRKMEVTEIVTTPSGVFDLFGMTLGWWSAGPSLVTDQMFVTLAADTYIDGAIAGQSLVDGAFRGDTLLDGATAAQSEPN